MNITSGTLQATNSSTGQTLYSGNINGGNFNNNTSGGSLSIGREVHRVPDKAHNCARLDDILAMTTYTAVQQIPIGLTSLRALDEFGSFYGGVECLVEEGDTTRNT